MRDQQTELFKMFTVGFAKDKVFPLSKPEHADRVDHTVTLCRIKRVSKLLNTTVYAILSGETDRHDY